MTEKITDADIQFLERQMKWETSQQVFRVLEMTLKLAKAVKELQEE